VIVDYHMHLRNAAGGIDHTAAAVEPFVARAAERGVDEIGFTAAIGTSIRTSTPSSRRSAAACR
jgi:hypothetical protein